MEHKQELVSVPLARLVRSTFNVRRHPPSRIEELAALIGTQGLLQNLVVHEQEVGRGKSRRLAFGVAAGERRRRALLLLRQQGRLTKDHEVLCELVSTDRAAEVSLAENSGREPMHPADEFEAFQALIGAGQGIEDVAARFGVTPLTVQRRLRLAALSPKLLALYRQDGINLDQLMALALSDDHAVQERTWFDAQPWDRTPAMLRRRLTAGEVEASGSALAQFVGIEAYEAAGGVVRRDLFDVEQSRFLSDPALLEHLAAEKLDALAGPVRAEGWAWVEARVEVGTQGLRGFIRCPHTLRRATAAERRDLQALQRRQRELEAQSEALEDSGQWSADESEVIDLELQDIEDRRAAILEAQQTWPPEVMAHTGAIITIGRGGRVEVIRGLGREADRKALAVGSRGDRGVGEVAEDGPSGPEASSPKADPHRAPGCSAALTLRLAAHRTMALQAMLVRNPHTALAVLVHTFVQRLLGDPFRPQRSALQVSPQGSGFALEVAADDLKSSRACREIEAATEAWRARLPAAPAEWLAWLMALPQCDLLDLLALCSALTLNALPKADAAADATAIGAALGLDMADWWEPTAEGYLKHVPKVQIIQALTEAGRGGGGVEAMNKDALAATAVQRLAGTRWLPAPLRRASD